MISLYVSTLWCHEPKDVFSARKNNLVFKKSAIFWDLIIVLLKASLLYINEYLTYNVENETSIVKMKGKKSSQEVRLLFSDVHKVQSPSQVSHASRPYDLHRILIGRTLFHGEFWLAVNEHGRR